MPVSLRNKCPSQRSVERCQTYASWKSDRAAVPAGRAGASREVDQAVADGTLRTSRGKSGKAAKPTADEALGGEKRPDKDYENLTDEDREFMATLPDLFPANTARTMRKGASEQLSEEDEAARDEGIDFDVE